MDEGRVTEIFWVYSARTCRFSSSRLRHGHGTRGQAWITAKKTLKMSMKHWVPKLDTWNPTALLVVSSTEST